MIVDPDFFEHWRTRMLRDSLGGDELAPLYVLRVWAHCQTRRATSFDLPALGLKALCRFSGDADLLERAMIDAGFVQRNGESLEVPKWGEHNAKLIANWTNGASGGRPSTKPSGNPHETHDEPTRTHEKPIREDRNKSLGAVRAPRKKPASACPETFEVNDTMAQWAVSQGLPAERVIPETEKFLDHWRAVGKLRNDWDATWRNWIRKAVEYTRH